MDPAPRIAVIGGGVAGLSAARKLRAAGMEVHVFDKGRAPAGRISSRHLHPFAFDHGAQYFTARTPAFRELVSDLAKEGVIAPWTGRLVNLGPDGSVRGRNHETTPCWVGVPGMNAVAQRLAHGLDVHTATCIVHLDFEAEQWTLIDDAGDRFAEFDAVVLALPAPQAARLLAHGTRLRRRVEAVRMDPCLALMIGLPRRYEADFDGAFVAGSPLAWIARNSSKPGRPPGEAWVLHANADWSRRHFHADGDEAAKQLLDCLEDLTGIRVPAPVHRHLFRWRFARAVTSETDDHHLGDADRGLVVCGDWCGGSSIEDAWRSGLGAAVALRKARFSTPLHMRGRPASDWQAFPKVSPVRS